MLAKRIITTLMLNNGVLYRSKNFKPDYRYTLNFIDMWSVDEVVVIDISRDLNFEDKKKEIFFDQLRNISMNACVPLTAGGGIRTLANIEKLLKNGADKVLLNTICFEDVKFIKRATKEFGSQCIVVSIDAKFEGGFYYVMKKCGQERSPYKLNDYIKITQDNQAGEIFLQSVDRDGSLLGYDLKLLDCIENIQLPLIVSSGAGNWDHVKKVLEKDFVSAASLTNIFHFTEKSIRNLKNHIKKSILIRE
jgi:imidazole glycerol-phosphate synthase subunit HisF